MQSRGAGVVYAFIVVHICLFPWGSSAVYQGHGQHYPDLQFVSGNRNDSYYSYEGAGSDPEGTVYNYPGAWHDAAEQFGADEVPTELDHGVLGRPNYASVAGLGEGLVRLARLMEHADTSMRSALMRHLCYSLKRLRTVYRGMPAGLPRVPSFIDREVSFSEEESVLTKLQSILAAAKVSHGYRRVLGPEMILPFARVLVEAEDVLFSLARKEDSNRFRESLSKYAILIRNGLVYLKAGTGVGASNALRSSILDRAEELDCALLEAQKNLRRVVEQFKVPVDSFELGQEKVRADLEGPADDFLVVPPPPPAPRPSAWGVGGNNTAFDFVVATFGFVLIMAILVGAWRESKRMDDRMDKFSEQQRHMFEKGGPFEGFLASHRRRVDDIDRQTGYWPFGKSTP